MATEAKFQVVDRSEVPDPTYNRIGRPMSPITIALLEGKTIFVAKQGDFAFRKTLRNSNKRLRTRRGERDGIKGMYLWTEEIKEGKG